MRKAAIALIASLLSLSAVAATPERSKYEQVLVPMFYLQVIPGANGSLWKTDFLGRNNGTTQTTAFQNATDTIDPTVLAGGATFHIVPQHDFQNAANPGVFLYVEKDDAANVSFSLRLRELSKQGDDFVELPVVRERDFTTATTQLIEVPSGAASRVHLRIYGSSSPNGRGDVVVRVFSEDGVKLFERAVSLKPASGAALLPTDAALSTLPAYAELPNLTQLAGVAGRGNLRVEIEPVTAGLRYWSFISVTNNATQRVSTITAQ